MTTTQRKTALTGAAGTTRPNYSKSASFFDKSHLPSSAKYYEGQGIPLTGRRRVARCGLYFSR